MSTDSFSFLVTQAMGKLVESRASFFGSLRNHSALQIEGNPHRSPFHPKPYAHLPFASLLCTAAIRRLSSFQGLTVWRFLFCQQRLKSKSTSPLILLHFPCCSPPLPTHIQPFHLRGFTAHDGELQGLHENKKCGRLERLKDATVTCQFFSIAPGLGE